MQEPNTHLAFCETPDQVVQVVELYGSTVLVVALTPMAAWHCQKRGVRYTAPDRHYRPEELAMERPAFMRAVSTWVAWLDEFLRTSIPAFAEGGFYPARAQYFFLQRLWAENAFGTRIVNAMLAAYPSSVLVCWPWEEHAPLPSLDHRQPIITSLLPAVALRQNRQLLALGLKSAAPVHQSGAISAPSRRDRIISWISQQATGRLWEELRLARMAGFFPWLQSVLAERSAKPGALFIGHGYDLDPLALVLRSKGSRVRWLSPKDVRTEKADLAAQSAESPAVRALWPTVVASEAFRGPLAAAGIEPNSRLDRALAYWWNEAIPALWASHTWMLDVVSQVKPAFVVAGNGGSGGHEGALLGAVRHKLGIPAAVYQHGGSANLCDWASAECVLNTDLYLVYGEGPAAVWGTALPQQNVRGGHIVPVGSARVDQLKSEIRTPSPQALRFRRTLQGDDPRPLIVYVPSHYGGYGRSISELAAYPDVAYFELQQRILRVFARHPQVRLVYKNFLVADSFANPIPEFLKDTVPNATVTLVRLTELMPAADAIIVDHAITALGEALATNKPVVVYNKVAEPASAHNRRAMELLRRRATVAESEDEFERNLDAFLTKGDFSPLAGPDDQFLAEYCTYRDDGKSAIRAAKELLSLATNSTPDTATG